MSRLLVNQKVVEICCGIGGTRKAFSDAGFDVVQSVDFDEVACKFHKKFWGDVEQIDINQCELTDIMSGNILAAGFPCQPFSTSGYRTGFSHTQGNVFSSLIRLIDHHGYDVTLLENVQGLLSNDKNRTFKMVLYELSQRYKYVEWVTFNLLSLGIPMNRPRVVIIAHNFNDVILSNLRQQFFLPNTPDLFPQYRKLPIEGGRAECTPNELTGKVVKGDLFLEQFSPKKDKFDGDLMHFIFGKQLGKFNIYSGRFWGRTGKTIFYISENQYSHSIGTSMGGAPTFGFDPKYVNDDVLEEVKRVSNYQTEHSGFYVFRLTPQHALKFFGEKATIFGETFQDFSAPLAAKYKLIGNLFAPNQAFVPINVLREFLERH
jgi:site-specific DNA-cytosine methylase